MKRAQPYVTPASLEEATARWLAEVRQSVRPRPTLRPQLGRCALLVMDLVHYFAHPKGRAYLPAVAAVEGRIGALLTLWRESNAPVIFTRHRHQGPNDLGMMGRFYRDHIQEGLPESELVAWLGPRSGESVVGKNTYDAFFGTELEATLRAKGVEQVLITGVLSHLCCETTARQAFVRGFEVYLAADAMATTTERLHLGSLLALADGFAVVLSAQEVAQECAR